MGACGSSLSENGLDRGWRPLTISYQSYIVAAMWNLSHNLITLRLTTLQKDLQVR